MAKMQSYLKGLAGARARSAGDVQRLTTILQEVQEELHRARMELASCDTLIKKFDQRLDPNHIEPIHATKGRYRKHGSRLELVTYIWYGVRESLSDTTLSESHYLS